ncbi:Isoleucine--tRNA ligase [uncultured archaeon]|nr:Isoleucine--tRNA ligase [uncultured archaeon]
MIATTRPELLHACIAVVFNPHDARYKHLDGQKAITPFGKEVLVIADKDVDKEFGTGLVMLCTFGDKMDVVWMHRYKLPMIEAMDRYGKLINAGEFNGLKAEEAKKKIMEKLETEGKVVKKEPLKQAVKVHDRCGTPVELLTSMQWFADIKTTGKRIKEMAKKVKWIPDFGISYLIDWVEGAEWDWVISRQRVFGTPLPFYYCEKCSATEAADEKELPFSPERAQTKACKECGGALLAETSTCDVWVDSSITPLIVTGWQEDDVRFARMYPTTLRPQGVEIVRTWAFYTIYRSGVALTSVAPWKEILLNGNVLAPDGKKMSKSLGNVISPAELLSEYQTDAIRQWAAMSGAMAKDRPFSYEDLKFAKSFLSKVWNAAKFIQLNLGEYKKDEADVAKATIIDRWMLQKLNLAVREYTDCMEAYDYQKAVYKMHDFFRHDFCDHYLEYVKHRIYGKDEGAKKGGLYTVYTVLESSILLLAPIAPHITEEIYRDVFSSGKTVHKARWPEVVLNVEGDIRGVDVLREVITLVRQQKAAASLAQNADVAKVIISDKKENLELLTPELLGEIKNIVKIKEIETKEADALHVSLL